jgi:hypothetical protein
VVQSESSADKLLVAVASPSPDGARLNVTLIGEDWTGPFALKRSYTLYYGDMSYTSEFAAVIALGVLEGRWKMGQGLAAGTASTSDETGWSASAAETPAGSPEQLLLTAQFASLQEWQQMRTRLGEVAGPQNLQVGAMSSRGAEVSVAFPGGARALQQRLAGQGLQLGDAGGRLVLRAAN